MTTTPPTILVVDDVPTNLSVLLDLLTGAGFVALVADSGERALLQVAHRRPDLILLDAMMPGLDGFETCRRLRAGPATRDLPVLFMTALTDTSARLAGFAAGAVDYISKPFEPEEMLARLRVQLELQRLRRALEAEAATPAVAQDSASAPVPVAPPTPANLQEAYFAGGCFWCMQYAFDKVKGVKKTIVGYTGGQAANPSYEDVSSGITGHAESIKVIYDPAEVTYPQLLDVFWHNVDPTAVNRQFADEGSQYRTEIWYRNEAEQKAAEESKAALGKSGKFDKPIATRIDKLGPFYPAEDYHQEYYQKSSLHFNAYEIGSGRAGYLKRNWGTEPPHS